MNKLPKIGSLRLRKDLWDGHGASIASVSTCKETILEINSRFFAAVLSLTVLGIVYTREA